MQPNDDRNQATPYIPPRDDAAHVHVPHRTAAPSQQAAANIARGQVESILEQHDPIGDGNPLVETTQTAPNAVASPVATTPTPEATPEPARHYKPDPNPYHHTHSTATSIPRNDNDTWKTYHSAWQRYYQEYYSRYYVGELYKAQGELVARHSRSLEAARQPESRGLGAASQPLSQHQAMTDIRSRLRQQIQTGAKKARGSKHFIPITSAIVVMLVFVFLQFNSIIFAAVYAYKSPGNIDPVNVLTNPSANLSVSKDPMLIIPKLNIDVPVDYGTTPDYDSQMAAMKKGTAYFGIPGANAKPGQVGNFGIAGHSSNQLFDNGTHKFIFVNLDLLQKGDLIYLNYQGTRYTYSVTHKNVVAPNDVAALQDHTKKPEVTLITCTPSGTALHRLLVSAEQISPAPASAKAAPSQNGTGGEKNVTMPGNSPTLLERLFN